jgi:Carboxypeptidase regulatory-like domain
MPKPGFTLGILATICWLCLDISIQAQPGETKAQTATVSGLVTLKGEPARGVTVLLQGQQGDAIGSPRARTDENGRFQITRVAAGRYSIYAITPGYTSPDDDRFGRRGRALNVTEGENVENIALEIKRGGVIAGRITDSHGRPMVEEMVSLHKLEQNGRAMIYWPNSQYNEMYMTDDRGDYRVYGLPEGRYRVSVGQEDKPGSARLARSDLFYPRVFYPNVSGEAEAKVIEVTEGSEATNIDITVPDPKKTYNVYGRAVDAVKGQPVPSVELVIGILSQDSKPIIRVAGGELSGPNGEFHMRVVSPGKYALWADAVGRFGSRYTSEPVIFDVSEVEVTGVEVKVRQAGSISGDVVIEGTSDPKISSKLSQIRIGSFYRSIKSTLTERMPIVSAIADVKVNADSGFRIDGLQPGNVFIEVKPSPEIRGLTVARIESNGRITNDGLNIGAGEQVTGVRVVMVYSALAIHGEVKVVGGALPAGLKLTVAALRVDQSERTTLSADVDARGQFLIESVQAGEYEVVLFPRGSPSSEQLDPQIGRRISSLKERVVVAGDNPQPILFMIDLSRKEENK